MSEAPKPVILVVEDEAPIRKLLCTMLGDLAEIHTAGNGIQALEWLQEQTRPPRLILTDVMMPGLDGVELARRLKKMPGFQSVPVVMLTAKGQPMDFITGINAGARHYITKPFTRNDLIEKIGPLIK